MKINVEENRMRSAVVADLDLPRIDFYPVFRGEVLEVEGTGDPDVSLRNLRKLLKGGLEVESLEVVARGDILVTFKHGRGDYLASGFGLDSDEFGMPANDLTLAFAQFAGEAMPGRDWLKSFQHDYPAAYEGPIDLAKCEAA